MMLFINCYIMKFFYVKYGVCVDVNERVVIVLLVLEFCDVWLENIFSIGVFSFCSMFCR